MKWMAVIIAMLILNNLTYAQVGKVGINTTTPAAMLHVKDSSVVFTGLNTLPAMPGNPPVSGAGTRMMWYPDKAAFRSGNLTGIGADYWNKDNIGAYSTAMGHNTKASASFSVALGASSKAAGLGSTAMGGGTTASGDYSTALGIVSTASGSSATAMGGGTTASGYYSTAMGYTTIASGSYSLALGYFSKASGVNTTSIGLYSDAKCFAGAVFGLYNDTTIVGSLTNINPDNRLFQIGNGTAVNARSNAMTVLQNGNVGIGSLAPASRFHVNNGSVLFDGTAGSTPISGAGTRMMWIPEKKAFRAGEINANQWNHDSIGLYSVAMGNNAIARQNGSIAIGSNTRASGLYSTAFGNTTNASGENSTAIGAHTRATGQYSTAMGHDNWAIGFFSTAMGSETDATGAVSTSMGFASSAYGNASTAMGLATIASGYVSTSMGHSSVASGFYSTAMGGFTESSGYYSTALGFFTRSKSYAGTVIGSYNESSNAADPINFHPDNRVFQIGNGTADNLRSNAMTVLQNGNIGIGTTTPGFLLNFPSSLGDKISLWGSSGNHYGFGIQPSLLQIHTDAMGSDIGFGYGSSNSFTETMRIRGNGNVGIGVMLPNTILDVGGRIRLRNGSGGSAGIYLNNNDNSNAVGFIGSFGNDNLIGMYGYGGADWGFVMNTTNGNIGIGTAAPTEKLNVVGNGLFTGTVTASCGVLVCSDIRYKKNILPVKNALTSLQSIHGIYYNWDNEKFADKNFGNDRQIGFSAQELEKVYPEMVKTDADGYKTVDYSRLTPVLVEAIKEQQSTIEELRENHKMQEANMKEQRLQISILQSHAEDQKRIIENIMKEMEAIKLSLK